MRGEPRDQDSTTISLPETEMSSSARSGFYSLALVSFGAFFRYLSDVPRLVLCTLSLHNFLIRTQDSEGHLDVMALGTSPGEQRYSKATAASGYDLSLYFTENDSEEMTQASHTRGRTLKRELMTAALAHSGYKRPQIVERRD